MDYSPNRLAGTPPNSAFVTFVVNVRPAGPDPVLAIHIHEAAGLARVEAVLGNPGGFYVNVHAASQPGGLMRGQLRMLDVDLLAGMITNFQGSVDAIATQQTINSTILRSVGLRLGVVRRGE